MKELLYFSYPLYRFELVYELIFLSLFFSLSLKVLSKLEVIRSEAIKQCKEEVSIQVNINSTHLSFQWRSFPRMGENGPPIPGLIKTRFQSVSRFFFLFPDFFFFPIKFFFFFNPDLFINFFFFTRFFFSSLFYPDFPDSPLIFSILPYFALFFPQFSYSKGGNVIRCHFFPANPFLFFYSRGAWLRGKQKTYIFF